jgi:[NiFe] hydrogenase diaphorase moiety large subunit
VVRTPEQIHEEISESGLRGRGGAGFPTGLKWQLCRTARGDRKHVICNADEGEPGTFKDRVLLTRVPKQVFFGMVACAYAIGGSNGIVYLRAEYAYLRDYLEAQLQEMRDQGLLGDNILGRRGFNFDIRIQLGAGSYVCGEESALIESLEGKRGTPRLKPPFPAQAGYLGEPTCIDNVESFATITAVLDEGAQWFASLGTPDSRGTRLLSVAGDCARPGIYEIEFGVTLQHVLDLVGANDAWAVQVSGPSGECVSAKADAMRTIAFEDLPCNGSLTIFDHERDLLRIVREYMHFFVEESCGICTPCRVGNVDLRNKVEMIMEGKGRDSAPTCGERAAAGSAPPPRSRSSPPWSASRRSTATGCARRTPRCSRRSTRRPPSAAGTRQSRRSIRPSSRQDESNEDRDHDRRRADQVQGGPPRRQRRR